MLEFYSTKYGEIELQDGRIIEVRAGNCLAVLMYLTQEKDGDYWNLWTFYADEQHCKNIMKKEGDILYGEQPKRIRMNIAYKEAETLTKYLAKCGHCVEVYYNEEK